MRSLLLVLFITATASAQPAPSWRVAASGGLAGSRATPSASLSAERSVTQGLAVGARLGGIDRPAFDEVGVRSAGYGEAFLTATHRRGITDVRVSLGAGFAALDYATDYDGYCGYEPFPNSDCFWTARLAADQGGRAYGLAAVGVDVYPFPGVGVGGEVRVAGMQGPANVSSLELGLRVRFAR